MKVLLSFPAGLIIGAYLMHLFYARNRRGLNRMRKEAGLPPVSEYPRKTTMPPTEGKRVAGRPTNINEPNATIRQAQFRARRETRD